MSQIFAQIFQVQREGLKKLVDEGRFEVLTGGWVMTDEANVHLFAMVDQLIEGFCHLGLFSLSRVITSTHNLSFQTGKEVTK